MSRSVRKTKIFGNAVAESDKKTKQLNHQRERTHLRGAIAKVKTAGDDAEDIETPFVPATGITDPFGEKDGKGYFGDAEPKDMRK